MKDAWRVKHPELLALHTEAREKAARFQDVQFEHHPRAHAEIVKVDQALNRLLDWEARGK
jgi:hypothetical protein